MLSRVVRSTNGGLGAEFLVADSQAQITLWNCLSARLPEYDTCPFCGGGEIDRRENICTFCRRSLDFQGPGYWEVLDDAAPRGPAGLIGYCAAMEQVFQLIKQFAAFDLAILITGASGTGKETVARAIHQESPRSQGPFIQVNCGTLSKEWRA